MRTRALLIVSLAMLLAPGVSVLTAQPAEPTQRPEAPSDNTLQTRIFQLEYCQVGELAEILTDVMTQRDLRMALDERANRLIVTALPEQLDQIEQLLSKLDVPSSSETETPQVLYRVYMVELPSPAQNMKPFSLVVESSSQLTAAQFFNAVKELELQLSLFRQGDQQTEDGNWEFLIRGRAPSNEDIMRLLTKIPGGQMKELEWDDDTFTAVLPAAQVANLPAQLQQHLHKLLGEETQTVGYWFGNLSVPGRVEAPIGPWVFEMEVERATPGGEIELGVTVGRESQADDGPPWQILSNHVRGQLRRPIIIGYNRNHYGVRTMGALVIVPEAP